ncbi:MAG: glycosyltransferase family 9 protein [Thermodesulfobacteriota bacterium]
MSSARPADAASGGPTPSPRSVLVVVTRRIGDVLLATPLIRSLKLAWPRTAVDALVFGGTESVLAANPDLRRVLTVPARPGLLWHAGFLLRILRRYDVALSLQTGDRPTLYAFLAGRRSIGLQLATGKGALKRLLLDRWVPFDNVNTHTVCMHLALADAIGIPRSGEVVAAWSAEDARQVDALLGAGAARPLAVLHTYPKFRFKMWRPEAWVEVARWLAGRGFRLALTGSGDADELAYVDAIARAMPAGTVNAAGRLTLGASACLVSRARIYIGPDTVMTHIAAALGVPTAAIYGPTNPVKWGPWPRGHAPDANPWRRCGSQRVGNVFLLQGLGACVPCHLEGCERNIESTSDCLQQLPPARAISAIEQLLERREI